MQRYLLGRLLALVPVLFGISVLVFTLTHVVPGDPVMIAAGGAMGTVSSEALANIRQRYGFDRPLYVQYLIYMRNIFRGDFGDSLTNKRPVSDDLKQFFPATIELTFAAFLLAVGVGIPLGTLLAVNRGHLVDRIGSVFVAFSIGLPGFWLAILLLVIFYALLKWFPVGGQLSSTLTPPRPITGMYVVDSLVEGNWPVLRDSLAHLILPASSLALKPSTAIARMVRASLIDVLGADYIRVARAKGLGERVVIYRHALRNALIPTVTQLGFILASFLSGAIFVEWVYSWNGIGSYAVTALGNLDYNPVMAVTLIIATFYVLINLVVDMIYTLLDPRIHYD